MGQAIAYIVILGLIGVMFWALINDTRRKTRRTVQEYERDVAETKNSLLRAGMLELDKFVGNTSEKRAAVEYIKDEEGGMTKAEGKGDDAGRTAGSS